MTETTAVCKCGAGAHATRRDLCANGHPRVGFPGPALAVDKYSATFWRAAEQARRELREDIVRDAGHTLDDAPRALVIAADGLAQAVLVRDASFARLIACGGALTSAGRARRVFTVWLEACSRTERFLRLVGLQRRPRQVPDSLDAAWSDDHDEPTVTEKND